MNSSLFLLICSCFIVAAFAQNCPNCPDPQDPITPCGEPDCSLPENHQDHALFPHPDPNYFWQCFPTPNGWQPIARQCACRTVFNPFLSPRRCSFWFEEGWQPICEWVRPPVLRPCPTFCPDCETTPGLPGGGDTTTYDNGGGQTTTTTTYGNGGGQTTPATTTTTPPPGGEQETTPDWCNVCPPQCPPCIWFPCFPCVPCWCVNSMPTNPRRLGHN